MRYFKHCIFTTSLGLYQCKPSYFVFIFTLTFCQASRAYVFRKIDCKLCLQFLCHMFSERQTTYCLQFLSSIAESVHFYCCAYTDHITYIIIGFMWLACSYLKFLGRWLFPPSVFPNRSSEHFLLFFSCFFFFLFWGGGGGMGGSSAPLPTPLLDYL